MAQDIKTKLSTILLAIRERLIDRKVFPADRIWLSLRMNVPFHSQADQYCIILPLTQTVDTDVWDGASRYGTLMHGRINVYIRSRLALDQAYRDDFWLTDSTLGALDKLHQVLDALVSFVPEEQDSDTILAEPMRLLFTNEPRKDYDNPEWGEVMAEFEISYRLDLTISQADQ